MAALAALPLLRAHFSRSRACFAAHAARAHVWHAFVPAGGGTVVGLMIWGRWTGHGVVPTYLS